MKHFFKIFKISSILFIFLLIFTSCQIFKPKKVDLRERPVDARARAKQNIDEGRGISLSKLGDRSTNYEFSTSNPLWRASLELIDFIPLTTVDYSGGIIITDWYINSSNKDNESIKITIRFLSNTVQADSIKIIVHKKNCNPNLNCTINEVNSKISEELHRSILKQAASLEKQNKKK